MDLEIINNKGTYEIHGSFTNSHANTIATYFNTLLDTYYEIVICLKKVKQIDESALNVMRFIAAKAKRRSKVLFVLGKENDCVRQQFKKNHLNSLFKNDY